MTVVGAFAVLQIENVGQTLFLVILRADVLFLVRAVRTRALAGVVHPADQIVVTVLLAYAGKICREVCALHLIPFADRMTSETTARFEQFPAMSGIAEFVFGQRISER